MDKTVDFVSKYYRYALESERKFKIPALFKLAQGALESGWGKHANGNNVFGIKPNRGWDGKVQLVQTYEFWDTPDKEYPEIVSIRKLDNGKYEYIVKTYFKDYDSIAECFEDHNKVLLKSRYEKAYKHSDNPKRFATEIWKAGYATSFTYEEKMHRLIDTVEKIVKDNKLDEKYKVPEYGKVNVDGLNLRKSNSVYSKQLLRDGLQKGDKLNLLYRYDGWLKVLAPIEGWVANRYLIERKEEQWDAIVGVKALNIRNAPDGVKVAYPLLYGTKIQTIEKKDDWSQVVAQVEGWVMEDYVKY